MAEEISAILPAVYTVLIIGGGYSVLWGKFKFINSRIWIPDNKKSDFYEMNSYDKALQSLIAGVIVIAINCFITGTSYETISNFENLITETSFVMFIALQATVITYASFIWGMIEVNVVREKEFKKIRTERRH